MSRKPLILKNMALSLNDYMSEAGIDKWITETGCTDAPLTRANIRTALMYFAREMPSLPSVMALSFITAMDLSKPVKSIVLNPGESLIGFRTGNESPFKLFFARRGASPHSSGINTAGRSATHFVVRSPVRALESYTASAKDTWTAPTPDQRITTAPRAHSMFGATFGVTAMGGGLQLIIPQSYNHLITEHV